MTKTTLSVLLLLASGAQAAVTFTEKPVAARKGDAVTITFAVSAETDVAVTIEDSAGKAVRHLAAGIVGNPPPVSQDTGSGGGRPAEPLKPGLAQSLEWDGLDDYGKKAVGGPFQVRVALGLNPTFDGFMLDSPRSTGRIDAFAVGPQGRVYAFHKNEGLVHWWSHNITILDRDGKHLKTIWPYPADTDLARIKALAPFRTKEGDLVPHIYHGRKFSFYPEVDIIGLGRHAGYTCPAVGPDGRVYWMAHGLRLGCLAADGSAPYDTFLGPELLPGENLGRWDCGRPALAVSGDGKHIYLSGLGVGFRNGEAKSWLPCVYRVDLKTRGPAEAFVGKRGSPGKENGLLTAPRGLAVDKGLLYVADPGTDRVVVFQEADRSYVGEIKVKGPHSIGVDPASGAVYVCSYTGKSMPGLLICHAHHTPKEHGELQDMGRLWARAGCLVLVPDMLGHGERRQHPFRSAADYNKPFRVGRQDYYFRYDLGMQLHLAGETLMGWFAWDLRRCVDVLLSRRGVDSERIIILGAVAGGGDPVWKRLTTIWDFYDAPDKLVGIHGRGSVKGSRPESTHCTHIGPVHRESIHSIFKRWFDISVTERDESAERSGEELPTCTEAKLPPQRVTAAAGHYWDLDTLRCMTPELAQELESKRLCDLLPQKVVVRITGLRKTRAALSPDARRGHLQREWSSVLGSVKPPVEVKVVSVAEDDRPIKGICVERVRLEVEPGIVAPLVLLRPRGTRGVSDGLPGKRFPVVVAVAHAGKDQFLLNRAGMIAELLVGGAAVCLPDLRGLGETKPEGTRERWGSLTAQASTAHMHGDPMVAARLRDLRTVLAYLRSRSDLDLARIALWGDSFAATNPPDREFHMPRHMDDRPRWSEPLGGLLALLGALYEDDVCAVYVRGGLSDFTSVISEQFVYIPPDAVIPRMLTIGDLPDLAAALAPRPLRMDDLVDGFNRLRAAAEVRDIYRPAQQNYTGAGARDRLIIHDTTTPAAKWLLEQLRSGTQIQ